MYHLLITQVSPLTLGWIQNNASQTIIYNVANNGVLTRSQYLNNVLQSTTIIANYVNTNGTQTNCSWNSTNDNLTVNMTVSIGTTNTSRQFIITPREVQGAIILSSTNTTISATANSTIFGQAVTFTALVTPISASGIVTFEDTSNNGNILGTANLSGGQATFATSSISVGTHIVAAVYSGDAQYSQSTSSPTWTLTVIGPPTVTAISPNSGPTAGGTSVTITGTNFVSGATVTIGGNTATSVNVANSTTITATTPAGTAGAANLVVTIYGTNFALANSYTYVPAPTVTAISPSSGPMAGGTNVTITGTNFVSGASVTFGGTAATGVSVTNSTTITATTPSGNAGAVNVAVPPLAVMAPLSQWLHFYSHLRRLQQSHRVLVRRQAEPV